MVETFSHGKTVTHLILKCKLSVTRDDKSLGTLSNNDNDGSENVAKKWICIVSNLIASIWTHSICQMQATFPGIEFFSSKRGRKIRHHMSTSSIKQQIRSRSSAVDVKEMY